MRAAATIIKWATAARRTPSSKHLHCALLRCAAQATTRTTVSHRPAPPYTRSSSPFPAARAHSKTAPSLPFLHSVSLPSQCIVVRPAAKTAWLAALPVLTHRGTRRSFERSAYMQCQSVASRGSAILGHGMLELIRGNTWADRAAVSCSNTARCACRLIIICISFRHLLFTAVLSETSCLVSMRGRC